MITAGALGKAVRAFLAAAKDGLILRDELKPIRLSPFGAEQHASPPNDTTVGSVTVPMIPAPPPLPQPVLHAVTDNVRG
eukprot:gene10510-biopygen6507